MERESIVVLDGRPQGDVCMGAPFGMLTAMLRETGADVTIFPLREINIAHCIGCFGCWTETPGICLGADAGREIAKAMIRSDLTVHFTPVTFGGYSSLLKRSQDRRLPLITPFFQMEHGETRHPPRYARRPRVVSVGWQASPDPAEAAIFRMLAGRNAANLNAAGFAADVIVGSDSPDLQRERMRSLLSRQDPFPIGKAALGSIAPQAVERVKESGKGNRALLVIGSPKIRSTSNSEILGKYLLDRLREHGWKTESFTLTRALLQEEGTATFLAAADRCDLLILSFPLYVDSLPYLATLALEKLHVHRCSHPTDTVPRLVAICNCGYPEPHHTLPALAICRQFALKSRIAWAGSLSLGGGEAVCGGEPLARFGGKGRPPAGHVMRALDQTAEALALGLPVPEHSRKLMERCPIPLLPFRVWSWIFARLGRRFWLQTAERNRISEEKLMSRPYQKPPLG